MMSLAGIQGHLQDELTSLHSCRFCSYKEFRLQCSRRPQSLSCNVCVCVCVKPSSSSGNPKHVMATFICSSCVAHALILENL